MATERDAYSTGPIGALIDRGEERGCVDLKEVDQLAQALDLEDEDLSALYEQLHARHIELRDDCTRENAPEAPIDDANFATVTTDTLQLFLNEIGRHRLLTPVEEFDWRRGYRFPTYATWWIRQAVERGMDAKARTIKLPINLVRTQRKVARAENALALKLDRAPTDAEIAKEAEISLDDLLSLRDAARTVTSLDRPLGEGEDAAFGDLLPSEGPAPEDVVHVSLREETLKRALMELPDRERTVVALRYGIDGGEPTPLREIGRQLGITPERVRQIESKALGRLGRMRELAALRQAA